MSDLVKSIKYMALAGEEIYLKLCRVTAVDDAARTAVCLPVDGGAELTDVRLQASEGKTSGLYTKPAIGSDVVVAYLDRNNACLLLTTDIEEIAIDLTANLTINGGKNDGLVKVRELTAKLNTLEEELNKLKSYLASWETVPNDGGAALKTLTASWAMNQLTMTKQDELENQYVRH